MFRIVSFESERYYTRTDCLEELTKFLNSLEDEYTRITVVDIDKDFSEDTRLSDYSPRLVLRAEIIYKEENIDESQS